MAEGAVGRRRPIRRTVRGPALTMAAIGLAGLMAAPAAAQQPPCADALHAGENALWDSAAFLAADLTLDGAADAVYWRADSARVVVLIGSCDGEEVAERWRLGFDLPADCPADEIRVEPASLLVDGALIDRTCSGEQSASECAHLRRENERRRALMDAGGRALRIGGPSCTVAELRWSPHLGGFMEVPG